MTATAREREPDLAERVERLEADRDRVESDRAVLFALLHVLSARVSALDGDAEPIDDSVATIKGAAYLCGYSQSWVRKKIAAGKVKWRWVRGRILIDKASLPPRRGANRTD